MIEKLIHNPDGQLISADPWMVGKRVQRVGNPGLVTLGTIGKITDLLPTMGDRVEVNWGGKFGIHKPMKTALKLLD